LFNSWRVWSATYKAYGRAGQDCQSILFEKLKLKFPDLEVIYEYSPDWLGSQRFDIYIPLLNTAIEYNGKQHYEAIEFFGGQAGFEYQLQRDQKKRQKCLDNNCILFELKYDYDEENYTNLLNLIDEWLLKRNQLR